MADKVVKTAKASMKNLNIAPRKVRLIADLVKGQSAVGAIGQLQVLPQRSTEPIIKLIKSALANAQDNNLDTRKLVLESITVNKGRTLKRGLSRGRGRVTPIRKAQSHVDLILKESDKVIAPAFVIHEKPKKVKEFKPSEEPKEKPKFKEEGEVNKKGKQPGFMKKLFRRKAI